MLGVRLLYTGSRRWRDWAPVREVTTTTITTLDIPPSEITVVHGAAQGLDTIIHALAGQLGMDREPHRVTHDEWQRYGNGAGNRRNGIMVGTGALACLGFPIDAGWSGTRDCMTKAAAAGIPVWEYGRDTLNELVALLAATVTEQGRR